MYSEYLKWSHPSAYSSYTWVEVVEPGGGVAGAQDVVHGVRQVHRQAEHVEQKEDDIEHS